jgi:hypothetical protein
MVTTFKASIRNEKLNPKLFDVAFVLQEHNNSTHTSKTYLMSVTDVTKTKEVLSFINEKFILSQTGSIRENIWNKKQAPELDDEKYPEAVFFKTKNSVVSNIVKDAVNITNWGVKQKNSGTIFFEYAEVQDNKGNCDIEFNTTIDFSTSINNVKGTCCININTSSQLHICSTAI